MIVIPVEAPSGSYEVLVGSGALSHLRNVIPPRATRAAVVTEATIGIDADPGIDFRVFEITGGETAKSLDTIEHLCRQFADWGLTRSDVVVALGGGVVTDAAGFAAAIYHRGTALINAPTTLLAQVDAAVGGKTGVNLREGKNLVGAYWQPISVLCDTDAIASLPAREYTSACGELARCELLAGVDLSGLPLEELVAHCVRMKAGVVAIDEKDLSGQRALLNYGHTLAHALETASTYDLRHGEAVALGLLFAALLAHRLGRIDDARVSAHYSVVRRYGLPTALPPGVNHVELVELMQRDKKAVNGLTFVLEAPSGAVELVADVPVPPVLETLREMS